MIIDIPTKNTVQKMVDDAVRKEMNQINALLDRFRSQLIKFELKFKEK